MLYLILAIGCSSAIALIFKHSESRNMNRYVVTSANYVAAVFVAGVMLITGELPLTVETGLHGSAIRAGLLGIPAGIVFFLAFIYYQIAVRDNGVGLAGAFAKVGILVPMLLSLVLWREMPGTYQWLGITLAVGSILLVNIASFRGWTRSLRPALLMLFLLGGLAEFSNKLFQVYGDVDYRLVFLLSTFAVAGISSLVITMRKRAPIRNRDIATGLILGIPNLFSSFFLIMALNQIKATVVFPVFAAGTIVVINLVGVVVFGERLNRREQAAVGLTILALVLINL